MVPRPWAVLLAAVALPALSGCVDRLLQIRSEPPGAVAYVNGERVGPTPMDHRFSFYGTFDITLRAPGRVSVRRLETIRPPWYEVFPLDFFSENLIPWKLRDVHGLRYELEPARPLEEKAEVDRETRAAEERMRALEGRLDAAGP